MKASRGKVKFHDIVYNFMYYVYVFMALPEEHEYGLLCFTVRGKSRSFLLSHVVPELGLLLSLLQVTLYMFISGKHKDQYNKHNVLQYGMHRKFEESLCDGDNTLKHSGLLFFPVFLSLG